MNVTKLLYLAVILFFICFISVAKPHDTEDAISMVLRVSDFGVVGDNVHYNTAAQQEIGKRYAQLYFELTEKSIQK